MVLRAVVLRFFSSPEVTDDSSASDVAWDRAAKPVLRAAVPGAGRVGGLFKLEPAADERIVELPGVLEAMVDGRAVLEEVVELEAASGRRAVVPPDGVAVGRRGGMPSLVAADEEGPDDAMLRRAGGVAGMRGVGLTVMGEQR